MKDVYEFKYFDADGDTFTLKTHVSKIDFNGEKGFLYSFRKVSFVAEKENSTIKNIWKKQNSVSNEVFWEYNNIDNLLYVSKSFSSLLDGYSFQSLSTYITSFRFSENTIFGRKNS